MRPAGPEARITTHAAFGGGPLYLEAVDAGKPVEEDIVEQILSPGGDGPVPLETAIQHELAPRDLQSHRKVLAAVRQLSNNAEFYEVGGRGVLRP